jgi:carbon-monoxide dehydrogenase medium subunit
VLSAVQIPARPPHSGFAINEVARRHGDFALVGAVVALTPDGESGRQARVALFGVGPTPVRVPVAEEALADGAKATEVAALAARAISPVDDLHASAQYRHQVAAVLVERSVDQARSELQLTLEST